MRQAIKVLFGVVAVAMLLLSASISSADGQPTNIKISYGTFFISHTWFQGSGTTWDVCTSEWFGVEHIRFEAKWDEDDETVSWYYWDGSWKAMNDEFGTWGLCPWGWQCLYARENNLGEIDFEDGDRVTKVYHSGQSIWVFLNDDCIE